MESKIKVEKTLLKLPSNIAVFSVSDETFFSSNSYTWFHEFVYVVSHRHTSKFVRRLGI